MPGTAASTYGAVQQSTAQIRSYSARDSLNYCLRALSILVAQRWSRKMVSRVAQLHIQILSVAFAAGAVGGEYAMVNTRQQEEKICQQGL